MNGAYHLANITDDDSLFNHFWEEGNVDKAALLVNSLFILLQEDSIIDPAEEKRVSQDTH